MYHYLFVWAPTYLPFLLRGALVTLQLASISMIAAVAIGLAVALSHLHSPRWMSIFFKCYVEIWRDVPLIVQLLVIYFTLPQAGIVLPAFWAGVLGLSLNLGAYLSEVFRAALASVDNGQREAARSLGMSTPMAYWRIILPQALLVALPTTGGYFIALLKDCSLVSFIAVNELLRNGQIIISSTFQSMEVYMMVAVIYFVMSFAASLLVRSLEWRLTPAYLRRPISLRAAPAVAYP
jgi:His/Glu/Gln/Arg/opine family amino acid ABC transporter permease subunit